ncbi:MAG: lysoplasmalogenase [Anaerolineales bacterium]|nr:lysoplasmalogenase [Chloroflexota bacterium]MBL6981177.1 lysoplasmalogenase [Anaerolineales bacterium]
MSKYLFAQIAAGLAVFNWLAVALKWKWLEYIAKPAIMLALIAFVWRLRPGLVIHGNINWLLFALFFSLAGDIFLMLPRNLFLPGLVSFLLAHIAYIFALSLTLPSFDLAVLLVILMVGLTSFQIYRRVAGGLEISGQTEMKIPIILYTSVISVMVIFALLTLVSNDIENYRALLLSAGALLFFISDTWIAWDRFVEPLKFRDLRVMVSYHIAQICLCLGFLVSP